MLTATDKIAIYKKGIDNQFVDPEFQEMMKAEIAKLEIGSESKLSVGEYVTYMADEPEYKMYGMITRYDGMDSSGHHMYRVDAYGYMNPAQKEKGPMVHDPDKHNQKFEISLKKSDSGKYYETAKSDYEAYEIRRKGGSKPVEPLAEPTKDDYISALEGAEVLYEFQPSESLLAYIEGLKVMIETL